MTSEERAIYFSLREDNREQEFNQVWVEELDDVFSGSKNLIRFG
jgi:hypothetical protein